MGLEWRSRYWSSSLFQQVEKHLNWENHGICVSLGKGSMEGGRFIGELLS